MSHREFVTWGVFYRASPFCDERTADRPAALIAATRDWSNGGRVEIDDLLPYPKLEMDGEVVDARAEAAELMDYLSSRAK